MNSETNHLGGASMPLTTSKILAIARKHVGNGAAMESSARLCLSDAVRAENDGELGTACACALRSLAYSVGKFHPDYIRVSKAVR
jgi:hypothetical protein